MNSFEYIRRGPRKGLCGCTHWVFFFTLCNLCFDHFSLFSILHMLLYETY